MFKAGHYPKLFKIRVRPDMNMIMINHMMHSSIKAHTL